MVVVCGNCEARLYEVSPELKPGMVIEAKYFTGINGHESPKPGDPMICPVCSSLFDSTAITTSEA